ncbi:MAG: hypothetical protein M1816_006614 [Peltula sp. TS41687]|nr:MAG: hypothetical protein M1816_006614 [Peltula sp. TS41687]
MSSSLSDPIHLPGNTLEGGGQLVRLALCLSSITGIPIHITNIRGRRPAGGGLKAQHVTCAKWLARACDAKVEGLEKGSRELTFSPGNDGRWFDKETRTGNRIIRYVRISQSSTGSIGLVLQAILPFLLLSSPSGTSYPMTIHLEIIGGTNVSHSPSYEYISQVLLPALENIGIPPISTSLQSRGWSVGGQKTGGMTFLITPLAEGACLSPFSLTSNKNPEHDTPMAIDKIEISIIAPREARKLIRRETRDLLAQTFPDVPAEIILDEDSQHAKRLYLLVVAHASNADGRHRLGRDWLYDRKITNVPVATKDLVHTVVGQLSVEVYSGSSADEYLQDQLIVFQALARGKTVVTPGTEKKKGSLHAQTARWVASEMLGVTFDEEDGSCVGVGYVAGSRSKREENQKENLDDVAETVDGLHLRP